MRSRNYTEYINQQVIWEKEPIPEQTVKIDIPFQTLMEALTNLSTDDNQKIWELVDAELFSNDECSPEEVVDIQAARADYEAGDYITFEQYKVERKAGKA
ncbi:MAG: hypothetical protein VKJ64_11800 [Leptolyngbyaceae bacterium]|nr:hypothetical protein [Leptolyngbyaceae bacterium]